MICMCSGSRPCVGVASRYVIRYLVIAIICSLSDADHPSFILRRCGVSLCVSRGNSDSKTNELSWCCFPQKAKHNYLFLLIKSHDDKWRVCWTDRKRHLQNPVVLVISRCLFFAWSGINNRKSIKKIQIMATGGYIILFSTQYHTHTNTHPSKHDTSCLLGYT